MPHQNKNCLFIGQKHITVCIMPKHPVLLVISYTHNVWMTPERDIIQEIINVYNGKAAQEYEMTLPKNTI